MDCLIIAAGMGSRLTACGDLKPLVRLCDIPLIEHVIRNASIGNSDRFRVVVGYLGKKLENYLYGLADRLGVEILVVDNPRWAEGNGTSVLSAADYIEDDFILLMADHIFDPKILNLVRNFRKKKEELLLAVDFRTKGNDLVDMDDVTKVMVENDMIVDIGKHLTRYNSFDTGIFRCPTSIFQVIESNLKKFGDASLSGGVQRISRLGCARAVDIGECFWIDVDDQKSFLQAEKMIVERNS